MLAAVRYAGRHGVVVVAAAGNFERAVDLLPRPRSVGDRGRRDDRERLPRDATPTSAAGSTSWRRAAGPTTANDPTCPKGRPEGRDIYQTTFPWAGVESAPRSSSTYRRFGLPSGFVGTSMAAPHVSAAAALVIASGVLGPDPTPQAVQERLQATAADAGMPGYDEAYGFGRLDAAAATDPAR